MLCWKQNHNFEAEMDIETLRFGSMVGTKILKMMVVDYSMGQRYII